jgi:hypothetical protein
VFFGQEGLAARFDVFGFGFVRVLLYVACVRKGGLRFFNKVALLLIKKKVMYC